LGVIPDTSIAKSTVFTGNYFPVIAGDNSSQNVRDGGKLVSRKLCWRLCWQELAFVTHFITIISGQLGTHTTEPGLLMPTNLFLTQPLPHCIITVKPPKSILAATSCISPGVQIFYLIRIS
jgi:hypothetical protein